MKIGILAGGQTAERAGTHGSAGQLAAAGQAAGFAVDIADLPADAAARADLTWMNKVRDCDVVIPLVPGLEGTLELAGLPFVGSDATAAGIGADKGLFNTLVQAWHLRTPRFVRGHRDTVLDAADAAALTYPRFVKPARLGASLGISKAWTEPEVEHAVRLAGEHDHSVVIEETVPEPFVEVEVAAIIGETVSLGTPTEIKLPADTEWHDTTSKYSLSTGLAPLPADHPATESLRHTTLQIIRELALGGAIRMDYFVRPGSEVYVGEVNCLPGHGIASTFPRILELSGVSRPVQFEMMVRTAIHHHARREAAFAKF